MKKLLSILSSLLLAPLLFSCFFFVPSVNASPIDLTIDGQAVKSWHDQASGSGKIFGKDICAETYFRSRYGTISVIYTNKQVGDADCSVRTYNSTIGRSSTYYISLGSYDGTNARMWDTGTSAWVATVPNYTYHAHLATNKALSLWYHTNDYTTSSSYYPYTWSGAYSSWYGSVGTISHPTIYSANLDYGYGEPSYIARIDSFSTDPYTGLVTENVSGEFDNVHVSYCRLDFYNSEKLNSVGRPSTILANLFVKGDTDPPDFPPLTDQQASSLYQTSNVFYATGTTASFSATINFNHQQGQPLTTAYRFDCYDGSQSVVGTGNDGDLGETQPAPEDLDGSAACNDESTLTEKLLCKLGNSITNGVRALFLPDLDMIKETYIPTIQIDLATRTPFAYFTSAFSTNTTYTASESSELSLSVPVTFAGSTSSFDLIPDFGAFSPYAMIKTLLTVILYFSMLFYLVFLYHRIFPS